MKIAVIGPGAIGIFLSVHLWQKVGKNLLLLDYNPERAVYLQKNGICLEQNGHVLKAYPRVSTANKNIGIQDYIFIVVKAFQTKDILETLSPLLGPKTIVISLQNGIGVHEILSEKVPVENLVLGMTMHGANIKDIGRAVHAGQGDTFIGGCALKQDDRINKIAKLLTESGIKTFVVEDIFPYLWKKLLVNIGINPITALACVRNGEILNNSQLSTIQEKCVIEAYYILKKAGIEIGLDLTEVLQMVRQVCKATSGNISSMLQDRIKKRRTEIDFINGAILRLANKLGVDSPVNSLVTNLINFLSTSNWPDCKKVLNS